MTIKRDPLTRSIVLVLYNPFRAVSEYPINDYTYLDTIAHVTNCASLEEAKNLYPEYFI